MNYPVALNLRIEPELRAAALAKAQANGLSLAEVVRRLLSHWLTGPVDQVPPEREKPPGG